MELATFGAILSFALEMETRATNFYTQAAHGELEELFARLAKESKKREIRIERTRREGITEMILEPISGLQGGDYETTLSLSGETAKNLMQAVSFEECAGRFYNDAAGKLPVREVAKTFLRMAEDSLKRKSELEAFQMTDSLPSDLA